MHTHEDNLPTPSYSFDELDERGQRAAIMRYPSDYKIETWHSAELDQEAAAGEKPGHKIVEVSFKGVLFNIHGERIA